MSEISLKPREKQSNEVPGTEPIDRPERRRVSARQLVYQHLQKQIGSGALARGTIISELQVSRDLHVSRSPVREAIGQLIADGLLEQTPNRSSVVVDLSRTDIIDLYEVREAIETFAARRVAERGLPANNHEQLKRVLDRLQGMIEELRVSANEALDEAQQAEFMNLDLRLHALLVLSTQNKRMQKIVHDTRLLVRIFSMRRRGHDLAALVRIQEQHNAIIKAVADRNGERAAKLLSQHIQASLQERLDEFDVRLREEMMREHEALLIAEAESTLG